MNYGETLAYWYLRLNGFFPLKNFVLHSSRQEERLDREKANQKDGYIQGADCDLIAVRFPHVYEEVGGRRGHEENTEGRDGDWDKRFSDWGFSFETEVIGIIVEVKTGDLGSTRKLVEALNSFRRERIKAAVQRMGMFERKSVDDFWVKNLSLHEVFPVQEDRAPYRIGKLLISLEPVSKARLDQLEQEKVDNHVLNITLEEIDDFIKMRLWKYNN